MTTIGTLSTYLENKLINHLLRYSPYSSPSSVWLALFTVPPSDTTNGTEVNGGGYARQNIGSKLTVSGNYAINTAGDDPKITFPEATGGWGTINGVAVMDNLGNKLFWGTVDNPLTVSIGEIFSINTGMLTIELKGSTKGGWGDGIPEQILKHVLKATSFTSPTTVYVATGSALSYDEDYTFITWGETSAAGYARKSVVNWYYPTSGSTYNLNTVNFASPPIANEWGRITDIVIFDSLTSGNALVWGKIHSPIYITPGDGLKFPAGCITVKID